MYRWREGTHSLVTSDLNDSLLFDSRVLCHNDSLEVDE